MGARRVRRGLVRVAIGSANIEGIVGECLMRADWTFLSGLMAYPLSWDRAAQC